MDVDADSAEVMGEETVRQIECMVKEGRPASEVTRVAMMGLGNGHPAIPKELCERVGACGKIWSKMEICYKCLTCQTSNTCIICADCFHNGDHQGHEWRMTRSEGGMCDCGDDTAWKASGFCSRHKGITEDTNPLEGVPHSTVVRCSKIIEALIKVVCADLRRLTANTTPRSEPGALLGALLEFLVMLGDAGDGARRLVVNALCDGVESKGENCPLSAFFKFERMRKVSPAVYQVPSISQLFLILMPDFHMKSSLALMYSRYAIEMTSGEDWESADSDSSETIEGMESWSVQFLTVPHIARKWSFPVPEANCPGLFNTFLNGLLKFVKADSDRNKNTRAQYIISELRYCLCYKPNARKLLVDHKLQQLLLRSMMCVQQAYAVFRQDRDSMKWRSAFELEFTMSILVHEVLELTLVEQPDATLISECTAVLGIMRSFISDFVKTTLRGRTKDDVLPYLVVNSPYTNQDHGIHFQLPVHRTFSNLLSMMMHYDSGLDLSKLLRSDVLSLDRLIEHPLMLLATRAQVAKGMWRRNHLGILEQMDTYSLVLGLQYAFAPDLFLVQAAASLSPSYVVAHLARRVSVHQPLVPHEPLKAAARDFELIEPFLSLVLQIASDSRRGLDKDATRELHLRHHLAEKPRSHSDVNGFIHSASFEQDADAELETMTERIADYTPPEASHDRIGRFRLKESQWEAINPSYFWDESTLQLADTLYSKSATAKARRAKYGVKEDAELTLPPCFTPPMEPMRALLAILHSSVTLSFTAATIMCHGKAAWASDGAFRRAVAILLLALRTRGVVASCWEVVRGDEERFERERVGEKILPPPPFRTETNGSAPPDLIKVLLTPRIGAQSVYSALLSQRRTAGLQADVAEILHCAAEESEEARAILQGQGDDDDTSAKAAEKAKMARARAKQSQLLQRMKMQQASLGGIEFSDSEDEGDEMKVEPAPAEAPSNLHRELDSWPQEAVCALCHKVTSPDGSTDIGLITLATKGNGLYRSVTPSEHYSSNGGLARKRRQLLDDLENATIGELKERAALWSVDIRGCLEKSEIINCLREHSGKTCPNTVRAGLVGGSPACMPVYKCQMGNMTLHQCGHVLHIDCFKSFMSFMESSRLEEFKGQEFLYVERKEFLCLLCGRVANSICPVFRGGNKAGSAYFEAFDAPAERSESSAFPVRCSPLLVTPQRAEPLTDTVVECLEHQLGDLTKSGQDTLRAASLRRGSKGNLEQGNIAYVYKWNEWKSFPAVKEMGGIYDEHWVKAIMSQFIGKSNANKPGVHKGISTITALTTIWAQMAAFIEVQGRLRSPDESTDVSISSIASLRAVLKAILFSEQVAPYRTGNACDGIVAMGCFLGRPCEVDSPHHFTDGSTYCEVGNFPPLMCCDVFGVWVQMVVGGHLKVATLDYAAYRFTLLRSAEARLVQVLLGLFLGGKEGTFLPSSLDSCPRFPSLLALAKAVQEAGAGLATPLMEGAAQAYSDCELVDCPDWAAYVEHVGREVAVFLKHVAIVHMAIVSPSGASKSPDVAITLPSLSDTSAAIGQLGRVLELDDLASLDALASAVLRDAGRKEASMNAWISQLHQVVAPWPLSSESHPGCPHGSPLNLLTNPSSFPYDRVVVPLYAMPPTRSDLPPVLIHLPKNYTDLLARTQQERSIGCGRTGESPAVCLYCGAVLCWHSGCCSLGGLSSSSRHAKLCGGESGVFLLPLRTEIFVVRAGRYSFLPSVYLDVHGEEDTQLRRGRPLFLSSERYASYAAKALTTSWDFDTRVLESTYRHSQALM